MSLDTLNVSSATALLGNRFVRILLRDGYNLDEGCDNNLNLIKRYEASYLILFFDNMIKDLIIFINIIQFCGRIKR